nr:MAG TPA: hypothetical protein [Caudoviricetes sp.]
MAYNAPFWWRVLGIVYFSTIVSITLYVHKNKCIK